MREEREELLEEISQLRSELQEARSSEVIVERSGDWTELRHELESFGHNLLEEHGAADDRRWQSMLSEVGHISKSRDNVRDLSEEWASQVATRDRELRFLRERED